MAPEILEDAGYNQSSDIFSAGVILAVLLTGRPVFRGYNLNEILLKNKKCEVEYPAKYWSKISDKAKDLLNMPEKLISMLWKSGHLHKGETCVHCEKGSLTALKPRGNGR